jgi:hypothetical protein
MKKISYIGLSIITLAAAITLPSCAPEADEARPSVQPDWGICLGGCYTITGYFATIPATPGWVTANGIVIEMPGTVCGTNNPSGVACTNIANIPATVCGGAIPLTENVFWASRNATRPFYYTSSVYFTPGALPLNAVQTMTLTADPGDGFIPADRTVELQVARRVNGFTFRYRRSSVDAFGNRTVRTYPQLDGSGVCVNRIFGARPETFSNFGNEQVDFDAPQVYQPGSSSNHLRVNRDAGPLCGTFDFGYQCTRYVHATTIVSGECWFLVDRMDSVGARITDESTQDTVETRRLRRNATCFTP